MGAFIPGLRRKYPFHEYVSAVMLVVGLILFTLADAQTSPNFSMIGVAMVSGALVMDAFLGNLQEAIFKMNPDTTQVLLCTIWRPLFLWELREHWHWRLLSDQMEMLFCSTVVGLPFLVVPMVLTGELMTAWNSCSQVNKRYLFPCFLNVLFTVWRCLLYHKWPINILPTILIIGYFQNVYNPDGRKRIRHSF